MKIFLQFMVLAFAYIMTVSLGMADESKPAQVLFINVNVFDGVNESLMNNASVLIEGILVKNGVIYKNTL